MTPTPDAAALAQRIRCDRCGYETTVDPTHNIQTDLMIREVGGTHVCDRFEYGYFKAVKTMTPTPDAAALAADMRYAVDAELPEDEPNDVRDWVYETCAKVALSRIETQLEHNAQLRQAIDGLIHAAYKIQVDWEGTRMGDAIEIAYNVMGYAS